MTPRPSDRSDATTRSRGQANLAALGVALVLLTAVGGLGIALADGALASADREPLDRRGATTLADRLVAPDAPTTYRANVLREGRIRALTAADVEDLAPPVRGEPVRLRLDDETLLRRGDPTAGTTVRRIALVGNRTAETRTVRLANASAVTLPRRTSEVRLRIDPAPGGTVETVRANDRVVLHDPAGIDGEATVGVSRYETVTLAFGVTGDPGGEVTVTYYPTETTKSVLEVTVGG